MFILLCMISLALAEPPVRDSYVDAAQFNNNQASHQQYLPPDVEFPFSRTSFNSLSNQYLPPSAREVSQKYGPPDSSERLTQEYGLPSQGELAFRSGVHQEYGAPIARFPQNDLPNSDLIQSFPSHSLKSGVSKRYGAPSSKNIPSNLYVSPSQRNLPSTQYGAPNFRLSNEYKQQPSPVQKYGVPSFSSRQSNSRSTTTTAQEYGKHTRSQFLQSQGYFSYQKSVPSQTYGAPTRSLAVQYGTPAVKNAGSSFEKSTDFSKTTYEEPKSRNLNQYDSAYQTLPGQSDLNTDAFLSSYSSTRSPSLEYGAPSSRTTMPSQVYGVPQHSLTDQDNEYARNALELLNQEPANYEFAYKVGDDESGSNFGHTESRHLDKAEGTYFVLLPDGTKQVVEYEADEDGFKPRISVEPADTPTAFSSEGPY